MLSGTGQKPLPGAARGSTELPVRFKSRKETLCRSSLRSGTAIRRGTTGLPRPQKDASHKQDARLKSEGALIGIAGTPVQVRNPDGVHVETIEGPFMSSALPIAGFAIIDAADLEEAIKKVSQVPCAVAHGVVEVWPLE